MQTAIFDGEADFASTTRSWKVYEPSMDQAAAIARMFEASLGKGGYLAEGHDQYPDPGLFTAAGIEEIIDLSERQLLVAELGGELVGGMIIDWLDSFHCEFNCLAARLDRRGLGTGSVLFREAKRLLDQMPFVVNTTELVTHSMASQTAYLRPGFDKITGFSFCHYPHVFFANHPESVLWASRFHGKLFNVMKELKSTPRDGNENEDSTFLQAFDRNALDARERSLCMQLMQPRQVYVPTAYRSMAEKILRQFGDTFDFEICSPDATSVSAKGKSGDFQIDRKGNYRYCHLNFPCDFQIETGASALESAIEGLRRAGKKFIFARVPINRQSSIPLVQHLREEGFVFHSILPLYTLPSVDENEQPPDTGSYTDVLGLQWIAPEVLSANPFPGDTNSVVKLYGYPANLSGDIVSLIRKELTVHNLGSKR